MELSPEQLMLGISNARNQSQQVVGVDILRRLMSLPFDETKHLGEGWEDVLDSALAFGDEDAALEISKRLIDMFPNSGRYVMLCAERMSRIGRSDLALSLMESLKSRTAYNPALDYFLGVYSGHVGALSDAKSYFRAAIRAKPDFGDAWALLASANGLTKNDLPTLKKLVFDRAQHAMPGAAYALGQYFHSVEDYDKAWENWTLANEFMKARRPFNLQGELDAMKAIREADTRIWFNGSGMEPKNPRAIFVVGPPRSGTSLTEQIIGQSSDVANLGETMLSRMASWPLGNLGEKSLEAVGAFTEPGTTWERFGAVYRHLASNRGGGKPITTDKGAILHLFVGAMGRMLPNAKFVWVKRDPKDVALSGYRAYLGDGNRWRYEMGHAAAYLKAHDEMMAYWQSVFPDRVHVVDYEMLVIRPQDEGDRLMNFLELPRLDMTKISFGSANVATASFAQIRRQINSKSVGGWKKYRKWIDPAFEG